MRSGDIRNNEMFKVFFNSLILLFIAKNFQEYGKRRQYRY